MTELTVDELVDEIRSRFCEQPSFNTGEARVLDQLLTWVERRRKLDAARQAGQHPVFGANNPMPSQHPLTQAELDAAIEAWSTTELEQ